MRIEYIDLYDPDIDSDPELTKKENEPFLDKLKNIFKTLSKKDPLYSEITESVQTQKVIEKIGNNQPYYIIVKSRPINIIINKVK